MSTVSEPTGSLEMALSHASSLLKTDPALAARQAQEILRAVPDYPPAMLLWAKADFRSDKQAAALVRFASLVEGQRRWAAAHFEYSLILAELGRGDEAIRELRKTVELKPKHADAWKLLADHLLAIGEAPDGKIAYIRHIQASTKYLSLQQAAASMVEGDLPTAERLLKSHLQNIPKDVHAIRLLAELSVNYGDDHDAEKLLLRCMELVPNFRAARYRYAVLLLERNSAEQALAQVEQLISEDANCPSYRSLYAAILSRVGKYQHSSAIYNELLDLYPSNARIWLSYGHLLKREGQHEDCIEAYGHSIKLNPQFGEAYWSLAKLSKFQFSEAEVSLMQQQLADPKLDDHNKLYFHFALGRALERLHDYWPAFEQFCKGNALHTGAADYDADIANAQVKRLKLTFNGQFFDKRAGSGCRVHDPIFIVGMPKSGLTLVAQILSKHSQIEWLAELPEIISMVGDLHEPAQGQEQLAYDEIIASMSPAELKEIGENYIEQAQNHRKTRKSHFIHKVSNNFLHIGMIHAILPNAKIIDVRRHPIGCCLSNFKNYNPQGQGFSYSLSDTGRFYRDYVELMAHYDKVLPDRVHRVTYERIMGANKTELQDLLDYCGLPMEKSCLRIFDDNNSGAGFSSEKSEQWRNYQEWLPPLKRVLGSALEEYPHDP